MTDDAEDGADDGVPEPSDDEDRGDDVGSFSLLSKHLAKQGQMMERITENMLAPFRQQMSDLIETLAEYREELREAIESTIDLEEPWEYERSDSEVHDRAERVALRQLRTLVEALDEVDDPTLNQVQDRMLIGYQAYDGFVPDEDGEFVEVQPRIHEAIFVSISLQDGLMHWVCEQDETIEPDKSYPQRNVYYADTKQDALEKVYTSYHGIAPDSLFFDNLDAFYHHRNYIMHGHPEAHFDENIATAAILFFVLTLHTVLEELEDRE